MKTALLVIACSFAAFAQRIESSKLEWLFSYAGKTTNSVVVLDHRFEALLDAAVPKASLYLGISDDGNPAPLKDAAMEVLGGPPEGVVIRDHRYVILAACRPHSCGERGFFWVDTREGIVIGAITHGVFNSDVWNEDRAMKLLVYSKQVDANSLPDVFQRDLNAWIKAQQLNIGGRRFVDASGTVSPLSVSYFPDRLTDARAVYLEKPSFAVHADGIGDDAPALQQAIDRVQESAAAGIVFIPQGKYRLGATVNVWRGIRLIGYGANRPVFVLGAKTPGFDSGDGKYMIHFCNFRPKPGEPIADARGETFFSGINNVDVEIREGNPAAIAVRFHVAQLSSLQHVEFRIGSGRGAVEAIGNEIADCWFFGGEFAILTGKTAPGWPSLVLDCIFEGQRRTAIETSEAGLTAIRDQFRDSPYGIVVTEHRNEKLFVKDSRFDNVSKTAIVISNYSDPLTQINMENVRCAKVPLFLAFRDTGAPENLRQFPANANGYIVKRFAHGLRRENFGPGAEGPRLATVIDAEPVNWLGALPAKDFPQLPERRSWINIATLGAKGDGTTDDTAVFQQAIQNNRAIYVPMGRYRLSDTLLLKPDTALIGLNPQATQFVVTNATASFSDPARPKPVIETARNGRNIVTGIGVEPGHNPGAIAIKWTAGQGSYLDDVYLPWTERNVPKGGGQLTGLWVTDGGGGTFKNLWFPDGLADDGFHVTNTSTEGRVYLASVEHHVNAEITMRNVANWTWYALQTEENEGSDHAVSIDMKDCKNISFVNYFIYRMPKTPFPYAIRLQQSSNINFRGLHNFHWRGLAFENPVFDPDKNTSVPEQELGTLQIK